MNENTEVSIEFKVIRKMLRRILHGSNHPYFIYYTKDQGGEGVVIFNNPGADGEEPMIVVGNARVNELPNNRIIAETGVRGNVAHWRNQFTLIDPVFFDYHNLEQATGLFMERVNRALEK